MTWRPATPPQSVRNRLYDLLTSGDYIGEYPAVGEAMPDGRVRTWRLRDGTCEVKE